MNAGRWLLLLVLPEDEHGIVAEIEEACALRFPRGGWRARFWYARQVGALALHFLIERRRESRPMRPLAFGARQVTPDTTHRFGWERLVAMPLLDLRIAARRLGGAPGFTAIVTLTLALGVGATTAIWSTVSAVLFRPLPYPESDRIVAVWDRDPAGATVPVTFGTHVELEERARSFAALAVVRPWQPTLVTEDEPARLVGSAVSAAWLRVLGVSPALGRDFAAAEDRLGGPRVAIVSDGLWRQRFHADPEMLGRAVLLDDTPYAIVGVMPATFRDPLSPAAEIWRPLQYDMTLGSAWGHHLRMIGRLRPGTDLASAQRELDRISADPIASFVRADWASLAEGMRVDTLQSDLTRDVRPAFLALLGGVSLVLAIACVNVMNLLLARGARRRGEFALMAALGARRPRMIRQLLTESLLLAGLGGLAGTGVASVGLRWLLQMSPAALPRLHEIGVDPLAFGFGAGLTTLVGIACGLAPALNAARRDPHEALRHDTRRTAGGSRSLRRAVVVVEVALALVLLVGSGLLLRSFERLFAVEPGFDPTNVLTVQVQASSRRYEDAAMRAFFEAALASVRAVPGVTAAALTSQLPLSGDEDLWGVHPDPAVEAPQEESRGTYRYAISPGYFGAMRIPLQRGRLFSADDRVDTSRVTVVSESFARRRLPGIDPIGQRLRIGGGEDVFTVVGVVQDVKQIALVEDGPEAVYVPMSQWQFADNPMSLVIRGDGNVAELTPAVRLAVWSVDRDQPVVRVATLQQLVDQASGDRRFALVLFAAFAIVAVVMATAGIYGVLAGGVAERTREIGVRAALGASRGSILALVVREGMALTGLGVAIGLLAAAAASQVVAAMLFGVSRLDPLTYAGATLVLAAAALLACLFPARRAALVDPATTLRAE